MLQALKSYPFFRTNCVVTGHSSSMWLTDRAFLQMAAYFCFQITMPQTDALILFLPEMVMCYAFISLTHDTTN